MTPASRPVVLITGASSGIGEALAREYARRGFDLVLCARRLERLETLRAELAAAGTEALPVACDVTDEAQVSAAFAAAEERFGRLDVVIANAGVGFTGPFERLGWQDVSLTFRTNVEGVFHTMKAALAPLKRSRGKIALIGSAMSYLSLPESAAYSMSKHAVRALADSSRDELRAVGIQVTLVCPGFVATEIRTKDKAGRLLEGRKDPIPGWLNMPAATAARQIANGIARGRAEFAVTFHAKAAIFLQRHFPWLLTLGMRAASSWGGRMRKEMNR